MLLVAASVLILAPAARALPPGLKVQTYERGIEDFPVSLAWVPGTRKIFYTEKFSGRVRIMIGRELLAQPCADLNVESAGERGALGIAVDPDYPTNKHIYVYFSSQAADDNRVVRFTVEDNACTDRTLIISGIPAANIHNGGQLEFLDGYLFISTGDASNMPLAQNEDSLAGKILRVFPNGNVPDDNPFGTSNPVWSYGHRNAFGLAAKPDTSQLYESENGPQCDDELNNIEEGDNYGWGEEYVCNTDGVGPSPRGPMRRWTPTIAATDLEWYEGRLDAFDETLLMGSYKDGKIRRFDLTLDGTDIDSSGAVHDTDTGILDVAKGPGGWLYFLTSNAIKRVVEE